MENQFNLNEIRLTELSLHEVSEINGGGFWSDLGDAVGTGAAYVVMGFVAFYEGGVYASKTMPGLK
ncbi:MAG: hypothetical protein IPJ20_00915 [Flammeovirgaceae bacterium]|jgi:hypothetical protein|nr:hypothetical protein [Flammeovirgaceae bacterium]MBP9926040.1 hypothetical protein [Cyclobacteriaceae bacterium]